VLGGLPSQPQPSQKMFESRIWQTLRGFDLSQPVFVESESKKVGELRVPDAIMEHMRNSPCIRLELPLPARVALLMQDYAHFLQAPQELQQQLDFLTSLHGKEKIQRWKQQTASGQFAQLVGELLEQHYDPAYRRSIDRNFSRYGQAIPVAQADIADSDFNLSARRICEHFGASLAN
jgi:tRNA 2-selenouridine synthase